MKNIVDRVNDRSNITEGKRTEFEDIVKKTIQDETQQEKRIRGKLTEH